MTIKNTLKGVTTFALIISLAACSSWRHKSKAPKRHSSTAHTSVFEGDSEHHVKRKKHKEAKQTESEAVTTAYNDTESFQEMSQLAANDKCHSAKLIGGIEQHYYFAFDKSNVPGKDMASIKIEANHLHAHPNLKVRIEGHADDRGSREYNVALAARRANAVIAMLEQEGIGRDRINLVSYGAEKPASFGETEEAYQCNRRVDLVFLEG